VDLIGLNELAKEKGIKRGTLLRQLRAVERDLRIKLLIQEGPGSKVWVAMKALNLLRERAHRDLVKRVTKVEARVKEHEARISDVEGALSK
jgi:hypothetical protein